MEYQGGKDVARADILLYEPLNLGTIAWIPYGTGLAAEITCAILYSARVTETLRVVFEVLNVHPDGSGARQLYFNLAPVLLSREARGSHIAFGHFFFV